MQRDEQHEFEGQQSECAKRDHHAEFLRHHPEYREPVVTQSLDESDNKHAELHPVFTGILTMHADRQLEEARKAQADFLGELFDAAQAARFAK